jgi:hypothetical protein
LVAAAKDALRSGLHVGTVDGPLLAEHKLPYSLDSG